MCVHVHLNMLVSGWICVCMYAYMYTCMYVLCIIMYVCVCDVCIWGS